MASTKVSQVAPPMVLSIWEKGDEANMDDSIKSHAELMKSALRPGYEFDQLLVLDRSNSIQEVKESLGVTGKVSCDQKVTGLSLGNNLWQKCKATYDRRSSLSEVYQIGQSVRTNVVDVNSETSRITVSLKQSFCSSTDASFIQEYFLVEKISKLQSVDSGGSDLRWVEQFNLGCTVKGKVHEIKEFGVVVGFQKCNDVFGFISHYQLSGIPVETGSSIRTAVLDVSNIERLVDLSLKPVFVDKSKKETTNSQTQKLKSISEAIETSNSKRAKRRSTYNVGSLVQAEITEIRPLELRLKFGSSFHGRVHITEASDDNYTEAPFSNFRFEQTLTARIISKFNMSESVNRVYQWELSIKPSILAGSGEIEPVKKFSYSTGQLVSGFVYEVDSEWAWLTISRDEKRLVRLISHPLLIDPERPACQEDGPTDHSSENMAFHIRKGMFWVAGFPKSFQVLVECLFRLILTYMERELFILTARCDLFHTTQKQKLSALNDTVKFPVLVEKIEDLHPNMMVQTTICPIQFFNLPQNQNPTSRTIPFAIHPTSAFLEVSAFYKSFNAYVKNVTPKGCFVMLSRKVNAKVLLSNLSDGYVENPEKEFPVGKLVMGKLVSVEPLSKRVEVTLRTSSAVRPALIMMLQVGLCHVSEISDNHVDTIDSRHKAGDRVTAKILKHYKLIRKDNRISLGMKKSYFNDATSTETDARPSSGYTVNGDALSIGIESTPSPEKSSQAREDFDGESVDGKDLFLAEVESRASIPPLDVPLDDTENLDMGDVVNETQVEDMCDLYTLLQKVPCMEQLKEPHEVQTTAQLMALRTINVREELEKLNVWVAYFNLENEYGNPPEEAVAKVFQRALQYCDPKKVHLALLGMYERTEQHKLTDELLNKMVKKFKHSCKVWLRRVQWLLKQNQDGVQSVANRALLSLPPHKHIIFITQTAILEFKCGVPDRGCSLFEKMLSEYPKRTDLWSVYLDQCSSSLKSILSMKKTLGDDERMEAVKRKAVEYVESSLA
ncbi:hypothetical protein BC332_07798 [Capsicum chinense]|nr:hypothetical protein BC332_07798 [Capsicum chinense]